MAANIGGDALLIMSVGIVLMLGFTLLLMWWFKRQVYGGLR